MAFRGAQVRAAKSVTASIPITFVTSDSVSEGVVVSLNKPGANITGVDLMSGELTGKRLELLSEVIPAGGVVAFLTNTKGVQSSLRAKDFELAAPSIGRDPLIVGASTDAEIDSAVAVLVQKRVAGLVVENDPFFDSRRERLIQLTAERSIPAIYHIREFPVGRGLMSYGANLVDAYNQTGVLVGRILKGANVADMPVVRPTKFELAINLGTAKSLVSRSHRQFWLSLTSLLTEAGERVGSATIGARPNTRCNRPDECPLSEVKRASQFPVSMAATECCRLFSVITDSKHGG